MPPFDVTEDPGSAVVRSADLRRVLALPRVGPVPANAAPLLEQAFRRPGATMQLRPLQAASLAHLGEAGGLLALLPVGAGKTLVSLLAPQVLGCKRPLLLVPGKALDRARGIDVPMYARSWTFPCPVVLSYESLRRAGQARFIENLAPDIIVADECHKLKDPHRSASRRLSRYLERTGAPFVALTGSPTARSLMEIGHLALWALGIWSPLPVDPDRLVEWARAVDVRPPRGMSRLRPGALRELLPDDVEVPHPFDRAGAAAAVGARLRATAGVMCADEGFDGPLEIETFELPQPIDLQLALNRLEGEQILPSGRPVESLHVTQAAARMSLGVWYDYDPPPPEHWDEARKSWIWAAKDAIDSGIADTPEQAERVSRRDPELAWIQTAWRAWKAVRRDYDPDRHRSPVWDLDLGLRALRHAVSLADDRTLLWVRSTAVGREAAKHLRCGFYRLKGCDEQTGRFLEDVGVQAELRDRAPGPAVVSIGSGGEALNLQPWHRNIVLEPPAGGDIWEQMLGRTHRSGQTRTVQVLVASGRPSHEKLLTAAVRSATFMEQVTGQKQKLLSALGPR